MIKSTLFRKHFAIAAISIFGSVFAGAWIIGMVVQALEGSRERQGRQPPVFFVKFVEKYGGNDPIEGVKQLESLQQQGDPVRVTVLDESGKALYPKTSAVPEGIMLPRKVGDFIETGEEPRGPRPPFGPPLSSVVRLNGDPARYLLIQFMPRLSPRPPGPPLFPITVAALIVMVLLGIGVALFMIFRSLREHVEAADNVITELKRGNLKARFPIEKMDEIGQAKARFNSMADEIELLVERLRSAEKARNNVLQELTHDLRTPVASLGGILESVFGSVKMEPDVEELADLARKEIEYLGHLVEDLLLLAQLSEPHYKPEAKPFDLLSVLEEEAESIALRKGDQIKLVKIFKVEEALVTGNEHLCRRLARNALENAFSYARSEVDLKVEIDKSGSVSVEVHDDGPGFDHEALEKFGERRGQRMIKKSQGGRLSLGLGSVIMKSVVSLHRGAIEAKNVPSGGATVSFRIPA